MLLGYITDTTKFRGRLQETNVHQDRNAGWEHISLENAKEMGYGSWFFPLSQITRTRMRDQQLVKWKIKLNKQDNMFLMHWAVYK